MAPDSERSPVDMSSYDSPSSNHDEPKEIIRPVNGSDFGDTEEEISGNEESHASADEA